MTRPRGPAGTGRARARAGGLIRWACRLGALLGLACLAMTAARAADLSNARVSLIALGPGGAKAVLSYDQDWLEVDLAPPGGAPAARRLAPPAGCYWTSMSYEPGGPGLAMAAFCPAGKGQCREAQSLLLAVGADRARYRLVAETFGARWSRLYWRGGGAHILAQETALAVPMATNLADLGKPAVACEPAAGKLISLDHGSGQRIHLDILPATWRLKDVIAASPDRLIAEIALTRGGPSGSAAAAALEVLCADRPRDPLCLPGSVAVELIWQGGDWAFATAPARARRGRMIASADLALIGRERCEARWIGKRFRPLCFIEMSRDGVPARQIHPAEGLFGDLAMSPDGRWVLAVSAGAGRRLKQFDLFDVLTGARRSFPGLLRARPTDPATDPAAGLVPGTGPEAEADR